MKPLLIACECSGLVRDAFRRKGIDARSCDLLPSERPGPHHIGYLEDYIGQGGEWSGIIAFPPCTRLCSSGARWWRGDMDGHSAAIHFFMMIANRDCPIIAIENPVGCMSTEWRKPDQIIQPWQFGHGEVKSTCLWLKGLPLLHPTNIVKGRVARVHRMAPGPNRSSDRSRTFEGIADAMAEQWSPTLLAR